METQLIRQEYKIQMHRPIVSRKIDRERRQKKPRDHPWEEHNRRGRIICKERERYEAYYHNFLSCKKCPMHKTIGKKKNRLWCNELRCVVIHEIRGVRFSYEDWGKK